MSKPPVILVAGFGRCGTTMVMRMLDHGGIPVAVPGPSYENGLRLGPGFTDAPWLLSQSGKALKWLDPTASLTPRRRFAKIVWLDRDPKQQALSALKLMGDRAPDRAAVNRHAAALRADRPKAISLVKKRGPTLQLKFEAILADPLRAARAIAPHLAPEFKLSVFDAAAAVLRRPPECQPDLLIESILSAADETV